jgi:hypothetical protein
LVTGLKTFFEEDKSGPELQRIIFQLIGSEVLPSRVVIILDPVSRLETLEALAQSELFRNKHITVIAVAHKEVFDQWQDYDQRLNNIRFEEWYIPCLWQRHS